MCRTTLDRSADICRQSILDFRAPPDAMCMPVIQEEEVLVPYEVIQCVEKPYLVLTFA